MKCFSSLAAIAKRLEGKVALITGAASRIGESTARLFARHGANVVDGGYSTTSVAFGETVKEFLRLERPN
ncbi:hypothetical protein GH714_037877 [Hevea brasiliensis]|uniref:Uncharacterized protein n=1 Tax=Hevea brasiliensis TaxID=3981 RepID=A0A6A6KMH1_HEVBR|nr:hypothetical protein GH714_037877 [Hevea brasiliensis]